MRETSSYTVFHFMGALSEQGAGVAKAVWELASAQTQNLGDGRVHLLGHSDPDWRGTPPILPSPKWQAFKSIGPSPYNFSPRLARHAKEFLGARVSSGAVTDEDVGAPGIIHSHGLWIHANHTAYSAARAGDKPLIISPHGMLGPWSFRRSRIKKWPIYHLIEKHGLRRAACIVAASESEAADIASFGLGVPIAVIPWGVRVADYPDPNLPTPDSIAEQMNALDSFSKITSEGVGRLSSADVGSGDPTYLKDRRILLFLGRLHPVKAPEHLLGAWKRLSQKFSDWHLVFAGPNAEGTLESLMAEADRAGIRDRVTFLPAVSGERKLALLRRAEILVLPSHNENFGFVVPEALACGTPVIASDRTPWRRVVETNCGWNYPFGESGLTTALEEAMTQSPDTLRAMGLKGRELVETEFDWRHCAEKFSRLYEWSLGLTAKPEFVK